MVARVVIAPPLMLALGAKFVMDIERHGTGSRIKWAGVFVCALLAALAVFGIMRSGSRGLALIRLDAKGTTQLGPVPLANTNVRDAVFTVASHLNGGTVSVSVAQSTSISNLLETYRAMQRTGLTSVIVRVDGPTVSQGNTHK